MQSKAIAAAATLRMVAMAGAFAHGGATGVVKKRIDAMTDMGEVVRDNTSFMSDRDLEAMAAYLLDKDDSDD